MSGNTSPSLVKLHVLGNGGLGNPRCLYVFTDNKRYLFNCGEGTQRLALEHKLNLSKIDDVFLTRTSWDMFGGLPGLSMTLMGIGTTKITLHGPSDLVELYELIHHYGADSALSVTQHDYKSGKFKDASMEVESIELSVNDSDVCSQSQQRSSNSIFCYVCKFHDKPGTLQMKKCKELKVPAGPLLGKLKSGEDVTLPDGTIILSKDVVGEPEKGPILFVIDCPSQSHLNKLVMSDLFLEYRQKCINEEILNAVVHFTPSSIRKSQNYEKFILDFPKNTYHICLNETNPSLANVGPITLQTQLNAIDSKIFPLLKYTLFEEDGNKSKYSTGIECSLRPKSGIGFNSDTMVTFDPSSVVNEALRIEGLSEAIKEYENNNLPFQSEKDEYPEVIFVGTGSAIPSKYRNMSGILVKIDEETTIMLDCGEGTYGQLLRLLGGEIDNEFKKLKAIYISHSHADHQLGIIDILRHREPLNLPPLPLIIPDAVSNWLTSYSDSAMKIDHLFKVYPSNSFRSPNSCLLKSLKLCNLVTVDVPHNRDSLGIIFRTDTVPSYKIVYSGDAMPSSSLIREGMDCDILIHEATMEDDLLEDAVDKEHSTFSQAVEVGCKMKAKTIILTHFSQRYSKMPLIPETIKRNVGIAFDNMRVCISDMKKLPFLIKPLKLLFREEYEEMNERTTLLLNKKQQREDAVS